MVKQFAGLLVVSLVLATLRICVAQDGESSVSPYEQYKNAAAAAVKDRASDNPGTEILSEDAVTEEFADRIGESKKVVYRKTTNLGDLVMMDNTVGKVYPGSLLWAAAVRDGQLHQLEEVPGRPHVTVTISGLLPKNFPDDYVVSESNDTENRPDAIRLVSFAFDGSHSEYEERARPIFSGNKPGGPRLRADYQVRTSLEDALLSAGLSARYWGNRMSSGLEHITSDNRAVAVLTIDQVFYSSSADAPPLGGFLPDSLVETNQQLAERLALGAITGGEVVYVRKVDYGRRVLVALTAETSVEELKKAMSVSVKALNSEFSGNISDDVKQVWKSVEGKLVLIGGAYPDGVSPLFGGELSGFIEAVKAITKKENMDYDPEVGAVPVSFELGYVSDNAPMQVFETADFSGKIPIRAFGKITRYERIETTGQDAAVVRDDGEIDTDDWTLVQLTSQSLHLSDDRRTAHFDLVWNAYEANDDRSLDDNTIIRSSRRFSFTFPKEVRSIVSPTSIGARDEWYADELHSHQAFPDHGLLSNIRVKFDEDGDHDQNVQNLVANLSFTVWLEE